MAQSIALLALRNLAIYEGAIDGQTGAANRHPGATLDTYINLFWQSLRSAVSEAGSPWFTVVDAITAVPAAFAGEDYIAIPFPTLAAEIIGVDITSANIPGIKWGELDAADWSQRRHLNFTTNLPPGGLGWWTIKQMPEARFANTVNQAGSIALFPGTLTGSYQVTYLEQWAPVTDPTFLFVGQADWFQWVAGSVALITTGRDQNKKATYQAKKTELDAKLVQIKQAAKRVQRGANTVPMRRGGEIF